MDIQTVEIDGITVEVNSSYFTSWGGVRQAAEIMRVSKDENATDMEKVGVMLPYFEHAVANFADVLEAMGGDDANVADVIQLINEAISKAGEAKNH